MISPRLALLLLIAVAACRGQQPAQTPVEQTSSSNQQNEEARELQTKAARFAPVDLTADISKLPDNEKQALARLVQASRLIDTLFLRQVWAGNETMLLDLIQDQTPVGIARRRYFLINKGPWSRLDHNRVFVPGAPPKPEGANFYSAGATKAEVQRWLDSLTGDQKARATGFFTTIRRTPAGGFAAVYRAAGRCDGD
jgi:hypothetical protein